MRTFLAAAALTIYGVSALASALWADGFEHSGMPDIAVQVGEER